MLNALEVSFKEMGKMDHSLEFCFYFKCLMGMIQMHWMSKLHYTAVIE